MQFVQIILGTLLFSSVAISAPTLNRRIPVDWNGTPIGHEDPTPVPAYHEQDPNPAPAYKPASKLQSIKSWLNNKWANGL